MLPDWFRWIIWIILSIFFMSAPLFKEQSKFTKWYFFIMGLIIFISPFGLNDFFIYKWLGVYPNW